MTSALERSASLMFYALYLLFPNYPSYYFPCYMLILYNHVTLLKKTYKIIPVPYKLLSLFAAQSKSEIDDLNNSIVINKHVLDECGFNKFVILLDATRKVNRQSRIVRVIPGDISKTEVLISDVLNFNLKQCGFNASCCNIRPANLSKVSYCSEIDVSVVNNKWDLSSLSVIEPCLKNYFQAPKIVYPRDLIYVDTKKFASEQYYSNTKLNEAEFVILKCNKINGKAVLSGEERVHLIVFGETSVKQSSNVQSYLPPVFCNCISSKFRPSYYELCLEHVCPSGLLDSYVELQQAVKPFLNKGCPGLHPAFLLDGTDTSVMTLVVNALAKTSGLHVFEISSHDINANVYSHTETKLRNCFFKAKLAAPCIVTLHNFEYFDGQHDQRIMTIFEVELEKLFDTNTLPVILICMGNFKETAVPISRCFLETFHFGVPNEGDRVELLKWILSHKKLRNVVDIDEVVGKTNGFVYEDLNSLVYYAQRNALISDCNAVDLVSLQETDFEKALEIMQAQYGEIVNTPRIPKVNWSDVGGLTEVKHEIIKTINLPMKHFEFMKRSGLKRSGILLYGPPGTGKTLIAKAVATECNSCFLSVKGPELLNRYVGQSEKNIRDVFEKARAAAPCIIFFDELDSLAPNRGVSGDSGGVMDRVVSQLLAEMDGVNSDNSVFIIGATNRPDLIDSSLLRPGRFDKLLYVPPCKGHDSKLSVMLAQTRRFQFDDDVKLDEVVQLCPDNITGADFYGMCSNAWMSAARRLIAQIEKGDIEEPDHLSHEDVKVTMHDFTHAAKNAILSVKQSDLDYFKVLQEQITGKI